jgi:Na+/melibiose symporter-like transporter
MASLANAELRDYSLLALPLAVAGLPLYMHVPDFYVTEKGLGLTSIGLTLLLVRVVDAVQDPLIGALSDRFPRQRKILMLLALCGLGLAMLALLSPPVTAGLAWFGFWVIFATSSYSIATINLNAVGGIWSSDGYERTRIASTRERFGLVGVSLGVLIPGVLAAFYDKATAFTAFAGGLLLVLLFCGIRFDRWAKLNAGVVGASSHQGTTKPEGHLLFPQDKRIWRLILVTFLGFFASALPAVLFLFFVRDNLQRESLAWLYLLIYFASAISGVSLWRNLSRSSGKVKAWCLSIVLAVLAFTGAAFTGQNDIILYGLVCVVTGFALGGDLVFPASMMADLTGFDDNAKAHATTGFAWLSFSQKAALGLAAGVAFPILGWAGFNSGGANDSTALSALIVLYAIIPLGLKLIAALMIYKWRDYLEINTHYEKNDITNLFRAHTAGLDSNRMHKPYEN